MLYLCACESSRWLYRFKDTDGFSFSAFFLQANLAKPNQCEPQFVPTLGHEALHDVQENLQRIVSGHNHVVAITVRNIY